MEAEIGRKNYRFKKKRSGIKEYSHGNWPNPGVGLDTRINSLEELKEKLKKRRIK
jgi:hypothetical protein